MVKLYIGQDPLHLRQIERHAGDGVPMTTGALLLHGRVDDGGPR